MKVMKIIYNGKPSELIFRSCASCMCAATHRITGAKMCGMCGRVIDRHYRNSTTHPDCPLEDRPEDPGSTCFECGEEGRVYQYIHDGPKRDEVVNLCKNCYISAVCTEKCGKGFYDDEYGILACLLRPTGETVSGWFGDDVATYHEVEPDKCPKKMFDIFMEASL